MVDAIAMVSTIEDYVEPISALVDECKIHCNSEELRVRAVDPANVAMVDTALRASAFDSYEDNGELLGVNLDTFEDVLGLGDSDQLAHLDLIRDIRKLDIEIGSSSYTQALINPQSIRSEPDIPDLELPNTATLTADQLDHAVTAADLASDHIQIRVEPADDTVWFDGEGDTDTVHTAYDDEDCLDSRLVEDTRSLFSLDYLKDVVNAMPSKDTEVRVRMGDSYPVKLEYEHTEGHATVTVMISPRVGGET